MKLAYGCKPRRPKKYSKPIPPIPWWQDALDDVKIVKHVGKGFNDENMGLEQHFIVRCGSRRIKLRVPNDSGCNEKIDRSDIIAAIRAKRFTELKEKI